ncbi:MAG: zinc-binding protein [Elusimicrobia bacterium RIFCSPLOWO2_01_FULL_54_10]|nr:MAG: zinc-binding protein [Elusimicrobia bacterium RIFCSPLOWO2_01_FULL_54_10]
MDRKNRLPLVYSCSGCSNVAQISNAIAVRLDREGLAEMSCIVGVGGDVEPLVRLSRSGREIIAIDGCPLQCVKSCLARHGVAPSRHFILTRMGMEKRGHTDYDATSIEKAYEQVVSVFSKRQREVMKS